MQLLDLHSLVSLNLIVHPRTLRCIVMTCARGITVKLRVQRDILIIIHSGHYDNKVPIIAAENLIEHSGGVTRSNT